MPTSSSAAPTFAGCSMNWHATPVSISTAWSIPRPASSASRPASRHAPRRDPCRFCWKLARLAGAPACAAWNRASRLRKESPGLRRRSPYGASRHSKGSSPADLPNSSRRQSRPCWRGSRRSPLHVTGGAGSPTARSCSALAARPSSTWSRLALPRAFRRAAAWSCAAAATSPTTACTTATLPMPWPRAIPPWQRSARGCSLRSRSSPRCNPAPNPVA